jgi:hypothetical protein
MFRKKRKIKRILNFITFIVLFFLILGLYNIQKKLPQKIEIIIKNEGANKENYVENKIKSLIQNKSLIQILFLKKKVLNQVLEEIPQIEYAKISFPLKIKIEYKLYDPVAKICNNFCALLNKDGFIFPGSGNFPVFYTEINFEGFQKIKKEYLDILTYLKELNINFTTIIILKNGDVRIVNDIIILMNPNENLQNQIAKLKFAKDKLKNIKYLDLRIPERIFFY